MQDQDFDNEKFISGFKYSFSRQNQTVVEWTTKSNKIKLKPERQIIKIVMNIMFISSFLSLTIL